ncbi:MAG: histidinol-phosphatase [candidate division WOR-3 bacterium]|nr:MAG: histidinol-phosphatase [candidate division WOR-3 bacterium]
MIDYHVHTHHSIDAEGTIDEYCSQAVKRGLAEICFTNHCELDPMRDDSYIRFDHRKILFSRDGVRRLQQEVFGARDRFRKHGLQVKFGLEVGFYRGIESVLQNMIDGLELDFLIGSIHCLNHVCIDSSREAHLYFSEHDADHLMNEYYTEITALIKSGLFDTIAHLDVYKKYGIQFYGGRIHAAPAELLREIFSLMKETETALEINTAGLRKINQLYPSKDIMTIARDQGMKLFTIGSDSHTVADLGKGISEGIAYAMAYGFDMLCSYSGRKRLINSL